MKKVIALISTEGKSLQQMQGEARQALSKFKRVYERVVAIDARNKSQEVTATILPPNVSEGMYRQWKGKQKTKRKKEEI